MAKAKRNRASSSLWADGGGIDDDGEPNPTPEPVLFAPKPTTTPPGSDKVHVLALRHHLKVELWHRDDEGMKAPIDYVAKLTDLGHALREAILAERGIRWSSDGVKIVPGEKPGDPPRWRAQIWDPSVGKKGGHKHLGYAETRGECVDLIVDWYRTYCGLDCRVEPPGWFKMLLSDAMNVQAESSDAAGGMAWDVEG